MRSLFRYLLNYIILKSIFWRIGTPYRLDRFLFLVPANFPCDHGLCIIQRLQAATSWQIGILFPYSLLLFFVIKLFISVIPNYFFRNAFPLHLTMTIS